jgi:hypothetical protein
VGRFTTGIRAGWFSDGRSLRTRRRGRCRTSRHYAISWLLSINPSRLARRNNLNDDIYRTNRPLVTYQVYVPATDVGEALPCVVNRGRAHGVVGIVDGELARKNRDQAWPGMRVPPGVSTYWPGVSDDIKVGIPFHVHLEEPPKLVKLVALQVEQAI